MVPLPGMTNGQQQSSKRSSNTVNKTSKKQKSTQREVSPQQTQQIGQNEFELLLNVLLIWKQNKNYTNSSTNNCNNN